MPFQLSQCLPGIFWFLASLSIYTFIFASKCAHESPSLTAHNSCILTHGWASESRISQLHLLMGKSGDKRTDKESLVLWHYPVVRDSSCEELKLSRDSAQLLKEPVRFFWHLDFALDRDNQNFFIPMSQKSWKNGTEPGTLEHGLLAGISSPNETFYVINLKEIFFFFWFEGLSLSGDLRFGVFFMLKHIICIQNFGLLQKKNSDFQED